MDLLYAISGRYAGEARLQRLLFLASHTEDASLQSQALQMANERIQMDGNTHRYKELYANRPHGHNESAWLQEQESKNRQARDVLVGRLSAAQSHLNKEAIRTAYLALAEHDQKTGELTEAFHHVIRAKDYCTNRQQTTQVSLKILELSLHLKNYASVRDYVNKVEHTIGSESTQEIKNKVLVASALERLAAGDFEKAAQKFALVAKHGMVEWPTVLAPEEVAMYAAFLALAVSSRDEMVALAEHPEALELVPSIREALLLFGSRAAYQPCWKILENHVFGMLELDLYMSQHLSNLQQRIREKTILTYWKAFSRVELQVMAHELGPGLVPHLDHLWHQLVDLIGRGLIQDTRIDMQTKTLVREAEGLEEACLHQTQDKLNSLTQRVLDDTYSMMIRLACVEYDLTVSDPSSRPRRGAAQRNILDYSGFGGDAAALGDSSDEEVDTPMVDAGNGMNPEDLY